ncbi:hypothetical protein ARMSODRAFT_862071, partial [Armillaria solidipes]
PLVDCNGDIFAVLAGRPQDDGYAEDADRAWAFIREQTDAEHWTARERRPHHRGTYIAMHIGISYGKGQQQPGRLGLETHGLLAERLLNYGPVQRIAAFGSSAFQLWSPRLYAYYKDHLDALYTQMPHLRQNFICSIFPCATFNIGDRVRMYKHRDSLNCPFGWCIITALGRFNPNRGGHIILWETKMVVEFPHASTILIPSATITHSNVPVADGDLCTSFTQFCSGNLFRYVDNGY